MRNAIAFPEKVVTDLLRVETDTAGIIFKVIKHGDMPRRVDLPLVLAMHMLSGPTRLGPVPLRSSKIL